MKSAFEKDFLLRSKWQPQRSERSGPNVPTPAAGLARL